MTRNFFCSAPAGTKPTFPGAASPARHAHCLRRFAADRRGATAMIFALTLVPMMGMIAAAIDYSDYLKTTAQVQSQIDAAVLAASSASSPGMPRDQAAQKFFDQTPKPKGVTVLSRAFTYDAATGKVSGTATIAKPMIMATVAGMKMQATVEAGAVPKGTSIRALDLAFCIDSTGSMQNTLSAVQNNAANFKDNLNAALQKKGMAPFDQLRVRVLYYRDYGGMGFAYKTGRNNYPKLSAAQAQAKYGDKGLGDATPIMASNFYKLPDENTPYQNYVFNKTASGGGDWPESGLECLWKAMHSPWTRVGDALPDGRKIQVVNPVIAIYTDAGAHPPDFEYSVVRTDYPADMPRTYGGMRSEWNVPDVIDQANKKILFYGNPDKDDDYYFGLKSGWTDVKQWPGFSNPGSLTSANVSFIDTLANGIVGQANTHLSQ